MKNVWTLKILDWNPVENKYQERYTNIYGSSIKARRAAIDCCTIEAGEKEIKTKDYSKSFYTLSSGSGSTHCIISKNYVW